MWSNLLSRLDNAGARLKSEALALKAAKAAAEKRDVKTTEKAMAPLLDGVRVAVDDWERALTA